MPAPPDYQTEVDFNEGHDDWVEYSFGGSIDTQAIQLIVTDDTTDATLEVSWNGTDVHKVMIPGTPSQAFVWSNHPRSSVWLRKREGTGTDVAQNVEICGIRESGEE